METKSNEIRFTPKTASCCWMRFHLPILLKLTNVHLNDFSIVRKCKNRGQASYIGGDQETTRPELNLLMVGSAGQSKTRGKGTNRPEDPFPVFRATVRVALANEAQPLKSLISLPSQSSDARLTE